MSAIQFPLGCRRNVSLIQSWMLRVSKRLLLWRRQSLPPSLTFAAMTSALATLGR